jgi:DNA repair protein RadC
MTLTDRKSAECKPSREQRETAAPWPGLCEAPSALGEEYDELPDLMPISDWPKHERPRERLLRHGASHLADAELLAIFLRTGVRGTNALELARALLARFDGSLRQLVNAHFEELGALSGVGPAKAAQLMAVVELVRRGLTEELAQGVSLSSPQAVRDYLRLALEASPHEVFMVLCLDAQNRLIGTEELFRGTLTQTSVYPREVVKLALARNAAAVIFAHNHPSGIAEPSRADELLTNALKQALGLVDIKVLDHFVIGRGAIVSFAERGLL